MFPLKELVGSKIYFYIDAYDDEDVENIKHYNIFYTYSLKTFKNICFINFFKHSQRFLEYKNVPTKYLKVTYIEIDIIFNPFNKNIFIHEKH